MGNFQVYIQLIQKNWWLIALAALAAFNLALFNVYNQTPIYRARAQFLVSPGPTLLAGAEDDLVQGIEALDKRSIVSTYAEILGSETIYAATVENLSIEPDMLSDYHRTAIVLPDASVLELTVEGPNPEIVALLANQVGERAINQIKGLYLVYDINLLDPAMPPTEPFSPNPTRDASIALVLGGIIGILLAMLREFISSPTNLWRQRTIIDPISSSYTSHYVYQLLEQATSMDETTTLALLKIANIAELKEQLPMLVWQQLLQQIVQTLRDELRGKDIVGHWDDATFAVLLPGVDGETAVTKLTHLYDLLCQPIKLRTYSEPIYLRQHIGVSTQQPGQSAMALGKMAERALTQAMEMAPPVVLINAKQKPTVVPLTSAAEVTYSIAKTS